MAFKLQNFTVDAFNRDVNRSGDLRRKYRAWSGYRSRISALIADAFLRDPHIGAALVLGAGNLNDMDLRFLCERLDAVMLSDADIAAMEDGIARQNLTKAQRGKISCMQSDYTGAQTYGLFNGLEALAQIAAPAEEIAAYIRKAFAEMAAAAPQPFPGAYPLVISCPIYTQLLYTQIEVLLKLLYEAQRYDYDDLNRILNAAYGAMPGILRRYNDLMLHACADSGQIVLLSDMIEMDKGSESYRQAHWAANDGLLQKLDADRMIAARGAELSQVGLRDFLSKTEAYRELYVLWPFDDAKEYMVFGCLAKIRKR